MVWVGMCWLLFFYYHLSRPTPIPFHFQFACEYFCVCVCVFSSLLDWSFQLIKLKHRFCVIHYHNIQIIVIYRFNQTFRFVKMDWNPKPQPKPKPETQAIFVQTIKCIKRIECNRSLKKTFVVRRRRRIKNLKWWAQIKQNPQQQQQHQFKPQKNIELIWMALFYTRRTGKRENVKVNNWSILFFNRKLLIFCTSFSKRKMFIFN